MNALFSNIHRQVFDWPVGYNYRGLKRQVLVDLVDKRDEMADKLDTHLKKSKLSYQEAVEAIHERDSDEPIPSNLGDFIVAAISVVIGKPIYVVKPIIERVKDANSMVKTVYNAEVEYLFKDDRRAGSGSDLIMLVFNGLDHYAPAVPKPIATLSSASQAARTLLVDAIFQVEDMLGSVPPSEAKISLTKSLRFMGAAKDNLIGARLTTGTTMKTDATPQTPIPTPIPAAKSTKMARKRAASALQLVPPAKEKGESEKDFNAKKAKYDAKVAQEANRCCKMAPNQCYCGEEFNNAGELHTHTEAIHIDKTSWQCPRCESVMGSKGKLWTHVRHHMGRYYHYCDIEYDDAEDKDKKGKPKRKVCDTKCDERSYMEYHREMIHELGRAKIRCKHCDIAQMTQRHKIQHERVCEEGEGKDGKNTHHCEYCKYGCRSNTTLRNHVRQLHHVEAGLPPPPKWTCEKCGKNFTTHGGSKGHTCRVKKPKRKPSAAKGKRKCLMWCIN